MRGDAQRQLDLDPVVVRVYNEISSRKLTNHALVYLSTTHAAFAAVPFLCHTSHDCER